MTYNFDGGDCTYLQAWVGADKGSHQGMAEVGGGCIPLDHGVFSIETQLAQHWSLAMLFGPSRALREFQISLSLPHLPSQWAGYSPSAAEKILDDIDRSCHPIHWAVMFPSRLTLQTVDGNDSKGFMKVYIAAIEQWKSSSHFLPFSSCKLSLTSWSLPQCWSSPYIFITPTT
ncbi:hypothetical protein EDC04DRAFT_2609538 [Pisolithus marmoratus]|nr:hypothetical protein EDC04DRAFT_2609538 [Pisolithus marmoratus]